MAGQFELLGTASTIRSAFGFLTVVLGSHRLERKLGVTECFANWGNANGAKAPVVERRTRRPASPG